MLAILIIASITVLGHASTLYTLNNDALSNSIIAITIDPLNYTVFSMSKTRTGGRGAAAIRNGTRVSADQLFA